MRLLLGLAAALAVTLAAPAASPAATFYVDDDRKECAYATHAGIMAAVSAAAAGDVVRVCKGTYVEQVTLPAAKPRLIVRAMPIGDARIVPPRNGVAPFTGHGGVLGFAQVLLNGEDQQFDGFVLAGPLARRAPHDACEPGTWPGWLSYVRLNASRARMDHNRISAEPSPACAGGPVGVLVGGEYHQPITGTQVDRTTIDGVPTGIVASDTGTTIQRNVISKAGARGRTGLSVSSAGGRFASNTIRGFATGIDVSGYSGGLLIANHVEGNEDGISVTPPSTSSELRSNTVVRNANDGIVVQASYSYDSVYALIRGNTVRQNGRDGISVTGCGRYECARADIRDNSSLDNGRFDCFHDIEWMINDDWRTMWRNNVGRTDSPSVLCTPPR